MVEKVTRKRTGKVGKATAGTRKPARRALLPRSSASDLRAILDAAERLYRAVHVAWARADLRERGVREVKVVPAKKPTKVEHKRRAVPSFLPGDPPPPPPPPWTFCTGNVCPFCGEARHLGEGAGGCDSKKRAEYEERLRAAMPKYCLRLGRGEGFCTLGPDHPGECAPNGSGVDPKTAPV